MNFRCILHLTKKYNSSDPKCQECRQIYSRTRNKLCEKSNIEFPPLPNINTRTNIICKDPSVAEKEIKRSQREVNNHRRNLVSIEFKKLMKKNLKNLLHP